MWVDPASILGISLTGGGSFEPELSSLVSRVCAPGVAFLDVGANEGYFSILAAERGAEVLAVEPQPACAELIRRNATINNLVSRVRVENVALSDSEVPVRLWTRPSTNTGAASIHRHWRIGRASIEVPAMTLDRLLNERCADSKIDLAKIDTEGAELSILRGASTALARQTLQRIQIDFHETVVGARRADECRQLLLGAGYECRSVENVWIWEAPMIRG
jgi:FkbM family methyltransferase